MSGFSNFLGRLSVGIKTSQFHRALSGMSDRQLADIGMTRQDIPRRAREMAGGL
jgi:hypothetical protein